jgi:hypothetical protein
MTATLVPAALVAVNEICETLAAVGVPLMTPEVALSERPAGRFVAANDVGELLAVIV